MCISMKFYNFTQNSIPHRQWAIEHCKLPVWAESDVYLPGFHFADYLCICLNINLGTILGITFSGYLFVL